MSYIQEKYGLTRDQELKLIRDGHLNPLINEYYETYQFYMDMVKAYKDLPAPKTTAVEHTCEMFRIKETKMYKIIRTFS